MFILEIQLFLHSRWVCKSIMYIYWLYMIFINSVKGIKSDMQIYGYCDTF